GGIFQPVRGGESGTGDEQRTDQGEQTDGRVHASLLNEFTGMRRTENTLPIRGRKARQASGGAARSRSRRCSREPAAAGGRDFLAPTSVRSPERVVRGRRAMYIVRDTAGRFTPSGSCA